MTPRTRGVLGIVLVAVLGLAAVTWGALSIAQAFDPPRPEQTVLEEPVVIGSAPPSAPATTPDADPSPSQGTADGQGSPGDGSAGSTGTPAQPDTVQPPPTEVDDDGDDDTDDDDRDDDGDDDTDD
ncbi:hypothetical protein [Mycetocola reblochoni]|uniref:Uncharacterized protein n=2 Tax=Mycetocola reblochoni TaxID=331618 RepID=A0A1R4K8L0_9MICO|nr:hypothetical protein [Mycetocola reblochoni]RLP68082.1 hypothetical protein D9V30_11280 [Mycetocola reblochoni]SJN40629.1 hypothetical protein FM119_12095 [Mycetocola reblochoni REB411]